MSAKNASSASKAPKPTAATDAADAAEPVATTDAAPATATAAEPAAASAAAAAAEPVSADDAAAAPADETKPVKEVHPLFTSITAALEQLHGVITALKVLETSLKLVAKDAKKLPKRRRGVDRPSNLTKPLKITEDLAKFLEVDPATEMTRGQVTQAINNYAKKNSLKSETNGRIIKLNDDLAKILKLATGDEIQIINVQSHLKDHYVKAL
jgi:chromatin remodeling complex protein RSC6